MPQHVGAGGCEQRRERAEHPVHNTERTHEVRDQAAYGKAGDRRRREGRQHGERLRETELERAVGEVHRRRCVGKHSVQRRNHGAERQKADFACSFQMDTFLSDRGPAKPAALVLFKVRMSRLTAAANLPQLIAYAFRRKMSSPRAEKRAFCRSCAGDWTARAACAMINHIF